MIHGFIRDILAVPLKPADNPRPLAEPFVYYLMVGPTTVKIGSTRNLAERIKQLRSDLQYVVAVESGGFDLERQRHKDFADERIGRREDFQLSDRLKTHIEALQPHRDELVGLAARPGGYRIS
jgi:Meiotically up-regulated gene 113